MAEEMRALDRAAEEEIGLPGLLLMENAGRAVADEAEKILGSCRSKKIVILAGKGNNGGDGFGAARWLQNRGAQVRVLLTCGREDLNGSAADERQFYLDGGGQLTDDLNDESLVPAENILAGADLIIDALLGTGFSGRLRGITAGLCRVVNQVRVPVLAVDIPTGVNADDGSADPDAVRAVCTVTMALPKPGLYLYPGRSLTGRIITVDIGMPQLMLQRASLPGMLADKQLAAALMPPRPANMHKGTAGRVLLAAGSLGYTGAAALASEAAVLAAAGLVTLLTPVSAQPILAAKLTEVMVKALPELQPGELAPGAAAFILQEAAERQVLALGPGLGTSARTGAVLRSVLDSVHVPCVIDADALTALAGHTEILKTMAAPKILTPHPGELGRLLQLSPGEIERQRVKLACSCAETWQAVVVLKGVPTVVACPDGRYYLNTSGNASMATGGSGDVLTGVIAALLAQGLTPEGAAAAGVYLHGLAGDMAAQNRIGLKAGQIVAAIPLARYALAAK